MPRLRSGSSSSAAGGSNQHEKPYTRLQRRKDFLALLHPSQLEPEPKPECSSPLEVPEPFYNFIQETLSVYQENPNNLDLDDHVKSIKRSADFYKSLNVLPSDWEFDFKTAANLVPEQEEPEPLPPKEIPEVSKLLSPIPLSGREENKTWNHFKRHDPYKLLDSYSCSDLSLSELKNDNAMSSSLCKFVVGTFNNIYSQYVNEDIDNAISQAQVMKCKYQGVVKDAYYFYMTITAHEQGKSGVYKVVVQCDIPHGAKTLCMFSFEKPAPPGETPTSKSKSVEDVDDGRCDSRDFYVATGMTRSRSRTKGFDFFNPYNSWRSMKCYIRKPAKV